MADLKLVHYIYSSTAAIKYKCSDQQTNKIFSTITTFKCFYISYLLTGRFDKEEEITCQKGEIPHRITGKFDCWHFES